MPCKRSDWRQAKLFGKASCGKLNDMFLWAKASRSISKLPAMLWFESVTFRWVVFIMSRAACAFLTVRLHERTSPIYLHFFFFRRGCHVWMVLLSIRGFKNHIHTLACSRRINNRLPTFLETCFCAITPVDFTRNPRSTSPGNNNTVKCVTSQFALPLRTSGTMRRINKSKAPRESAQQTLVPLQIPGSTQEISPLRPGAKTNKPLRRRSRGGPCGRNATTATTANTTKGKCCVCLDVVVGALSEIHFGFIKQTVLKTFSRL